MVVSDLGPDWLESVGAASPWTERSRQLRRFVRDAELRRGSNLAELDASHLRIARQPSPAVGALEMGGFGGSAKMLRGMGPSFEVLLQRDCCTASSQQG